MTAAGTVYRAGQLLRPEPTAGCGWVQVVGSEVRAVGSGDPPPGERVVDLGTDATLAPGLVDIHVHGGGGHTMTVADADEVRAATAFHLERGTTSCVVSLVTAPLADLRAQLDTVAGLVAEGRSGHGHVLGAHLEGPFLSPARRGVHPVEWLSLPTPSLVDTLLEAGRGSLRMVTLAPELPGSLGPGGALLRFRDEGVTVALGHTDAGYDVCTAALDAGASVGTHLFNGMRPMNHRDPGPAAAVLDHPGTTVELITDGLHVDPAMARVAVRAAGVDRLALITDAVAATGAPDGDYNLGAATIRRRGSRITLADGSSLGGSDLTTAEAVRRAVTVLGLSLADAVRAATAIPAAALSCGDQAGTLARGRPADLIVLDRDLMVTGVMSAGRWVRTPQAVSSANRGVRS